MYSQAALMATVVKPALHVLLKLPKGNVKSTVENIVWLGVRRIYKI